MSEERRLHVLRAIVQDYVSTSGPVGSKSLLERHQLGVSAATVRNDMAVLEDEGLIAAPHTSAGRIPTDAGYRVFVDRLSQIKQLSRAEKSAIHEFLAVSVDLDDVVDRTAQLLASLTHQVAVMQYPSLSRSTVQHIELVPISGSRRLMVVLILSNGRVEQRMPSIDRDLDGPGGAEFVAALRDRLNELVAGNLLSEARTRLAELADQFDPGDRVSVRAVVQTLSDLLVEQREERVVLAGTSNLARGGGEALTLGPVLEALEQHVVLLRLVDSLDSGDSDLVAVRIGQENPEAGLHQTSVVTTSYGSGGMAGLGVLGPTRMDYPSTMAAVRAVARYVSEMLDQ